MRDLIIGLQVVEQTAPATVEAIMRAEDAGVNVAWLTLGVVNPDSVTTLAVATARTSRIKLGTCIVPTYPRHPFALAQQAKAVAQLAPGRFRLGVGPSHQRTVEGMWGMPMDRPLSHLREYLQVLKAALQQGGQVAFHGDFFNCQGDWGEPVDMEIMASALRRGSFEAIGELADGAITWLCPLRYMENVAYPAIEAGARRVGRSLPRLVMQARVCVHDNMDEAREAGRKEISFYGQLPFYRQMLLDAGYDEAGRGEVSERMLDDILLAGDEDVIEGRLRRIAASPVDEVICSVVPAGANREASIARTTQLLARLARSG